MGEWPVTHLRGQVKVERGRFTPDGRPVMAWRILNLRNGKVIARDSTCVSVGVSCDYARELIAAARIAEIHEFELKDLR